MNTPPILVSTNDAISSLTNYGTMYSNESKEEKDSMLINSVILQRSCLKKWNSIFL